MARTVKFNKNGMDIITRGFLRPFRDTRIFFVTLGVLIDKDVQNRFRNEGAGGGPRNIPFNENWPPFSFNTLIDKDGNFRKRPGTDGSKRRKYSFKSKLLQASGGFRKSFKTLSTSKKRLIYGSNLTVKGKKIANDIMSNPKRNVLIVTPTDEERYSKLWKKFFKQRLVF